MKGFSRLQQRPAQGPPYSNLQGGWTGRRHLKVDRLGVETLGGKIRATVALTNETARALTSR